MTLFVKSGNLLNLLKTGLFGYTLTNLFEMHKKQYSLLCVLSKLNLLTNQRGA